MFKAGLEKLIDGCEGAFAAVVMGFDGVLVDSVSIVKTMDMAAVSGEFSFVLTQIMKAADILEVGGLIEAVIRTEELTYIVRILSDEYFVALALQPSGNTGKARFVLRTAMPGLRAILR